MEVFPLVENVYISTRTINSWKEQPVCHAFEALYGRPEQYGLRADDAGGTVQNLAGPRRGPET
jgi:hypothetical protein